MSSGSRTVWAGGGVLWRPVGDREVQVALVHRPRYDDWSLPKGKAEDGELLVQTAAREIAEETGFEARVGQRLRTVGYPLKPGVDKKVTYWSMEALHGAFTANHETDELRWLSIPDAAALLSYSADRKVLADFTAEPVRELHTCLLIRHAKAGSRSRFEGPDRQRPLDKHGRRQALALVDVLGLYGAHSLHAADRLRCVQTLEPTAEALRTEIAVEPSLTEEAYAADPVAAFARLRTLAAAGLPVRAVCSQGKAIAPLLEQWSRESLLELPASHNRKGSVWILTMRGDQLVALDHLPSPIPGEDD